MSKRANDYPTEDEGPYKRVSTNDHSPTTRHHSKPINLEKAKPELYIKNQSLLDALKRKGIKTLFPIQYETFDSVLQEYDLIARDRTGSGKTLAFTLPVLEKFFQQGLIGKDAPKEKRTCKFLVVLPTRF